jgi:imidazolonepropionase
MSRRQSGLAAERGALDVGEMSDIAVWVIERPAEFAYRLGLNPLVKAVRDGKAR